MRSRWDQINDLFRLWFSLRPGPTEVQLKSRMSKRIPTHLNILNSLISIFCKYSEKKGEVTMDRMELKEGTVVFTSGEKEVGKINRFILDPATHEVTHIVVQKGWLFSEDKVVPFEMVDSATDDKVLLSENIDSFDQLPPFEETHYIRAREADVSRGGNPRYEVQEPSHSEATHRDETVEADVSGGGSPRYRDMPAYYWY